jgi:integrase/recombinase XerD
MDGSKTVVGSLGERVAGEWFTELEVTGKSASTLKLYRYVILDLWLPWLGRRGVEYDRVERRGVIEFLVYLQETVSPASSKTYLNAVKSWYEWLEAQDYIHKSPATHVRVKVDEILPEPPPEKDIAALFAAIRNPIEAALAKGLFVTGCRISELVELRLERIRFDALEATIMGKGGRERVVYFTEKVSELWKVLAGGRTRGYLFDAGGNGHLKADAAYRRMETLSHRAKVENINPHRLRHAYATGFLERGANLRELQELLGHKSILSTQRYTHVARPGLKELYQRLQPGGEIDPT